jgi:glutamate/tyrosine decarboxylase-like PLP-dependent enzyme
MFSSADDQNTQSSQEQTSTQDIPIDTSFMKDMPQDVVEDLFKSEQMVEGNEVNTPSENANDEMPSEPISDLDQLLANNKNS